MLNRWHYRLLLLLFLGTFAVWLEPTRVVWGSLRGEAFYRGRPTSYWAEQIRPWDSYLTSIYNRAHSHRYRPRTSKLHQFLTQYITLPEPAWPDLLDGHADAMPVLLQLADHPNNVVRLWAQEGIERTRTKTSGPWISRLLTWDDADFDSATRLPGRDALTSDRK
jgi:hypothetical protein